MSNGETFNSKSWKEVEELLSKPFSKKDYNALRDRNRAPKLDANGVPIKFLPFSVVERRVVEALGYKNFVVEPIPLIDGKTEKILGDKTYICRAVHLKVINDDGCVKAETFGEASVLWTDKLDYNNLIENANQRATKRAFLHLLHINDEIDDEVADASKKEAKEAKKEDSYSYSIEVTSPMVLQNDCYRGEAMNNSKKIALKLWAEDASFLAKKYNRKVEEIVACFQTGKKFSIIADSEEFKGVLQLKVRDFVAKKEA